MGSSISGFTFVELIAVIVILGVLAATVIPRFIDLSDTAQNAAVKKIAGSLASAASLNHVNNIAVDAGLSTATIPTVVRNCREAAALLEGGLDAQYSIQGGRGATVDGGGVASEGGSSECRVAFDSNGNGRYNASDMPAAFFIVYGVRN